MIYFDYQGHMITDGDPEELHAFAKKIGLRREWYQEKGKYPHYDLTTENKQWQAVRAGAIQITPVMLLDILKRAKNMEHCKNCKPIPGGCIECENMF